MDTAGRRGVASIMGRLNIYVIVVDMKWKTSNVLDKWKAKAGAGVKINKHAAVADETDLSAEMMSAGVLKKYKIVVTARRHQGLMNFILARAFLAYLIILLFYANINTRF